MMELKAGEVIAIELQQKAEEFYWGKSGLLFGQACWVIPSAGDREDSATETHRLMLNGEIPTSAARVQRCGKSAPAASRGAG